MKSLKDYQEQHGCKLGNKYYTDDLESGARKATRLLTGTIPREEPKDNMGIPWRVIGFGWGLFVLISIFSCAVAHAEGIPRNRAVNAIIGEAENQGFKGMLAIACGIANRGHLRGVYGEKAKRVVKGLYSQQTLNSANLAWSLAINDPKNCGFLNGADHWENINAFGKPKWADFMVETYRHKDHVFYRSK